MGRVTWNNIKTSKRFYVAIYRYVSLTLLISLIPISFLYYINH